MYRSLVQLFEICTSEAGFIPASEVGEIGKVHFSYTFELLPLQRPVTKDVISSSDRESWQAHNTLMLLLLNV